MLHWGSAPSSDARGQQVTEQVSKPRSFSLQSPSLLCNGRKALCIIRNKGEAESKTLLLPALSYFLGPNLRCLLQTTAHWTDMATGQPTPGPWVKCTGCCDPDMVRGPGASLISICLSWTLSHRAASGKGLLSPGHKDLLTCFLASVKDELNQH